jgi:hypothetical protein
MEITVSKDSKILPIQSLTKYKDEEEILLDRNGSFICTSKYVKKIRKEVDMNILVCVYAKGYEIENSKDIKEVNLEFTNEEKDKILIERILGLVDEEELELYDNDKELKKYIKSLYEQIEPKFIMNKELLNIIFARMKSKYNI